MPVRSSMRSTDARSRRDPRHARNPDAMIRLPRYNQNPAAPRLLAVRPANTPTIEGTR